MEIIRQALKKSVRFSVVEMQVEDVLDYNRWWSKYYKKSCLEASVFLQQIRRNSFKFQNTMRGLSLFKPL